MASHSASAHESIYRDLYQPAVIIGACFAAVALVLSIFLIFQHLRLYTKPTEQKWVVAVVFMVPVYATESILSLWNPKLSLACDILRNCYEAFALYSFGSYLVACLGGERRVVELLENQSGKLLNKPLVEGTDENRTEPHWSLRNFFLRPCILGKHLLNIEKFGLVQYMAIAAVAHIFVFSTAPYHYISAYEYGKVTTETTKTKLKLEESDTPAVFERKETQVKAPGTSVTESVQDIVVDGGQCVVKDVVLTINQAIGPVEKGVEKGVTKIHETFHQRTEGSESGDQEVDEQVEMNLTRETHMDP
ncbi:hypothetical protein ACE6H2_025061 [Prunus campanulata]